MLEAVRLLTMRKVLVGFPKSTDERDPVATKQGKKSSRPTSSKPAITNAALAYINDQGSPLQGIPQREFMRPGIMDGRDKITPQLLRAGRASMRGDKLGVEAGLMGAGLAGQAAIRHKITDGPFVPLKPATLAARKRRGVSRTKPLTDTGQMKSSVQYVIK